MSRGRQSTDAPVDNTAAYKVGDSKSTQASDGKEAVRYSAIDLWKEAPTLTGEVARFDRSVKKANQPDYILRGKAEIDQMQLKIQETSPVYGDPVHADAIYAQLSLAERKAGLKTALMEMNPCAGGHLAEGLENMSNEEFRAGYWQKILRFPMTMFDVDFAATQGLVDQRGAMWVRSLDKTTRRNIEQLFYDYGFPVTKNHKPSDTTK